MITSCDPDTGAFYYVNNETNYELQIKYRTHWEDTLIIVKPMEMKRFFESSGLGNASDLGNEFLYYFEEINITTSDSLGIKRDLIIRSNWDYRINHEFGKDEGMAGGISEYFFKVKNSDIQFKKSN